MTIRKTEFRSGQIYQAPLLILLFFFLISIDLNAQNGEPVLHWRWALKQPPEWFAGPEAVRIADNLLLYQHVSGGWPKNINMATRLSDDEIEALRKIRNDTGPSAREITIDNGATYTQMHFLASVFESTGLERFKEGFLNGVDYLLEAQYENGGWPQYYPGREGYYENITFNDGAMIGVMNILRDIAVGKYPFVDSSRSQSAKLAIEKGVQAILDTQIEVEGSLTAWCAQYDPITLEPACARTYELKSISGSESVGILRYLMGIEHPDARIIRAVNEAIKWFDRVKLEDIRLIRTRNESLPRGFDLVVGFDPESKTPLWARFYEIGTNYPIFVGRDGVVKYALSEIEHERRVGYSWLGNYAGHMISEEYPAWCEKWNINNVIEESRTKNGEIRE